MLRKRGRVNVEQPKKTGYAREKQARLLRESSRHQQADTTTLTQMFRVQRPPHSEHPKATEPEIHIEEEQKQKQKETKKEAKVRGPLTDLPRGLTWQEVKGHWEDQRPQFLQWIRKEGRPTEDDWRRLLEWVRAMIRHRRLDSVSRMLSTLVYGDLEHRWTLDPAFPPFLQQCQREVFVSYHGVLKLV